MRDPEEMAEILKTSDEIAAGLSVGPLEVAEVDSWIRCGRSR
jgi:hypothetical protein